MSAPVPPEFVRLTELQDARACRSPGARLHAILRDAHRLGDRIREAGPAVSVRTFDLVTFPYPTAFGLEGAPLSPAPFVMMRNRVQLVQVRTGGRLINVLVNPSDPERSMAAPFFARQLERYGEFVTRRVLSQMHGTVDDALRDWGVSPGDIDYITFDHLHVQDVRGLLGTTEPEPGQTRPTRALLPNARLLAQADELATLECLHPLQTPWYVRDGLRAVAEDKIVALSGDYLIGPGLAIVHTPGHTLGNHTPVIATDSGLWTVSENGIAADSYAPASSQIPGLARYARDAEVEVILNANTREYVLDQYISMMLEKTLADQCRDRPEFPQHFPSSEMVRSPLAPGLSPTYSHEHITHGVVVTHKQAASSSAA